MGLNSSFMSLGQIIGPIWAGYALDLSYKLPFLSGATVMAVGWAITIVWGRAAGRGQRAHAAKTLS
jgi:DHA1 family multidrug resistance protein-like MFS transporter